VEAGRRRENKWMKVSPETLMKTQDQSRRPRAFADVDEDQQVARYIEMLMKMKTLI